MKREKKQINCGGVLIGGDAPVSIQSMTNTKTSDVSSSLDQIERLADAGCQIVRLAVPDARAVLAFEKIRTKSPLPLVADIHFDYRLAIGAIGSGADKIRINPGNIGSEDRVREVVEAAGKAGIPIRVGVNSGSLQKDILERDGGVTAAGLAESAMRSVRLLESMDFDDIVISLKSSNVRLNNEAYRIVHEESDHPLHVGVTEAGTPARGRIKSAAGIGALLLDGIGDTMRVSLTADPVEEVIFAKELLLALGLRSEGIEIISCPTCGRTQVDLERIVESIEKRIAPLREEYGASGRSLKLAVMGCAVNGPGEARDADVGVACGDGKGVLFVAGEIVGTTTEEDIPDAIMTIIEETGSRA